MKRAFKILTAAVALFAILALAQPGDSWARRGHRSGGVYWGRPYYGLSLGWGWYPYRYWGPPYYRWRGAPWWPFYPAYPYFAYYPFYLYNYYPYYAYNPYYSGSGHQAGANYDFTYRYYPYAPYYYYWP